MVSFVQKVKWACAGVSALAMLSGCASMDKRPNVGPCPVAASLYDASRLVEINGAELYENVGFTGEITGVTGYCRYVGDDPITMELDIDFAFGRGPAAVGDSRVYEYFVTVTRRNAAVISKTYFPLAVEFEPGQDRVTASDTVDRIVIPRANESISGVNFEVIVGFKLTDEELAFNRAGKRFRINAADAVQ